MINYHDGEYMCCLELKVGGYTICAIKPCSLLVFTMSVILNTYIPPMHIQLKFYVKFNKLEDIEIDEDSLGAVVCEDERVKEYHTQTEETFYICTLWTLVFAIILLVLIVWSVRAKIDATLEKNHANLAAFALTGLIFTNFVLGVDIRNTILVIQGKHEYAEYSDFKFANVYSLIFEIITTSLDLIAALGAWAIVLYLRLRLGKCCCECGSCSDKCALRLVALLCVAPLLCLVTHCGYIIIGWVTHAQDLAPVIFVYAISFFYYFITFRQLYEVCSKVSISCPELCLLYPFKYCYEKRSRACRSCVQRCVRRDGENEANGEDPDERNIHQPGRSNGSSRESEHLLAQAGENELATDEEHRPTLKPDFNFTAFFIEIQAGFFLAGAEFFVIYSLEQLPIALVSVPIGIYHAIRLAFVLITGLFTYKLISKPDSQRVTNQGKPTRHHLRGNQGNTCQQGTSYGATNTHRVPAMGQQTNEIQAKGTVKEVPAK